MSRMTASKTLKNKKFKIKCVWKRIDGYENYAVSNLGEVKNLKTGRILKPRLTINGYCRVVLWKNGCRSKDFGIHRLVADAFIPNPDNLPEVNHKDEDKRNNCVDNLEWCDRQYNAEYSLARPVTCVETGITYKSLREAERQTGLCERSICHVLKGRHKSAGGLHWSYADEPIEESIFF